MRRLMEGSGNNISQNPGVACGVPSTPQPARLTSFLTMPPSSSYHLEGQMGTEADETDYKPRSKYYI